MSDLFDAGAKLSRQQHALRLQQMREQTRANSMAQATFFRKAVEHMERETEQVNQRTQSQQRAEELLQLEEQLGAAMDTLGEAHIAAQAYAHEAHLERQKRKAEQQEFNQRQQERSALAIQQAREHRSSLNARAAQHKALRQQILGAERAKARVFSQVLSETQNQRREREDAEAAAARLARARKPRQLDFRNTRLHEQVENRSPNLPPDGQVPDPVAAAKETMLRGWQSEVSKVHQAVDAQARAEERYKAAQERIRAERYQKQIEKELAAVEAERLKVRQAQIISHRLRLQDQRTQNEVTKAFENNFILPVDSQAPPVAPGVPAVSTPLGAVEPDTVLVRRPEVPAGAPRWSGGSRAGLGRPPPPASSAEEFTFRPFPPAVDLPPLPLFPDFMLQQQQQQQQEAQLQQQLEQAFTGAIWPGQPAGIAVQQAAAAAAMQPAPLPPELSFGGAAAAATAATAAEDPGSELTLRPLLAPDPPTTTTQLPSTPTHTTSPEAVATAATSKTPTQVASAGGVVRQATDSEAQHAQQDTDITHTEPQVGEGVGVGGQAGPSGYVGTGVSRLSMSQGVGAVDSTHTEPQVGEPVSALEQVEALGLLRPHGASHDTPHGSHSSHDDPSHTNNEDAVSDVFEQQLDIELQAMHRQLGLSTLPPPPPTIPPASPAAPEGSPAHGAPPPPPPHADDEGTMQSPPLGSPYGGLSMGGFEGLTSPGLGSDADLDLDALLTLGGDVGGVGDVDGMSSVSSISLGSLRDMVQRGLLPPDVAMVLLPEASVSSLSTLTLSTTTTHTQPTLSATTQPTLTTTVNTQSGPHMSSETGTGVTGAAVKGPETSGVAGTSADLSGISGHVSHLSSITSLSSLSSLSAAAQGARDAAAWVGLHDLGQQHPAAAPAADISLSSSSLFTATTVTAASRAAAAASQGTAAATTLTTSSAAEPAAAGPGRAPSFTFPASEPTTTTTTTTVTTHTDAGSAAVAGAAAAAASVAGPSTGQDQLSAATVGTSAMSLSDLSWLASEAHTAVVNLDDLSIEEILALQPDDLERLHQAALAGFAHTGLGHTQPAAAPTAAAAAAAAAGAAMSLSTELSSLSSRDGGAGAAAAAGTAAAAATAGPSGAGTAVTSRAGSGAYVGAGASPSVWASLSGPELSAALQTIQEGMHEGVDFSDDLSLSVSEGLTDFEVTLGLGTGTTHGRATRPGQASRTVHAGLEQAARAVQAAGSGTAVAEGQAGGEAGLDTAGPTQAGPSTRRRAALSTADTVSQRGVSMQSEFGSSVGWDSEFSMRGQASALAAAAQTQQSSPQSPPPAAAASTQSQLQVAHMPGEPHTGPQSDTQSALFEAHTGPHTGHTQSDTQGVLFDDSSIDAEIRAIQETTEDLLRGLVAGTQGLAQNRTGEGSPSVAAAGVSGSRAGLAALPLPQAPAAAAATGAGGAVLVSTSVVTETDVASGPVGAVGAFGVGEGHGVGRVQRQQAQADTTDSGEHFMNMASGSVGIVGVGVGEGNGEGTIQYHHHQQQQHGQDNITDSDEHFTDIMARLLAEVNRGLQAIDLTALTAPTPATTTPASPHQHATTTTTYTDTGRPVAVRGARASRVAPAAPQPTALADLPPPAGASAPPGRSGVATLGGHGVGDGVGGRSDVLSSLTLSSVEQGGGGDRDGSVGLGSGGQVGSPLTDLTTSHQ